MFSNSAIFSVICKDCCVCRFHFFWLATFFWLQVCSFHMFLVFLADNRNEYTKMNIKKTIFRYVSYATGIPLAIVCSNVAVSLILSKGKYTGYDRLTTLMTSKIAFLITMIAPSTFVCLTNNFFLCPDAYKICSTPNVQGAPSNRIHLVVYVKLFTITGLIWLLQIIDTFVGFSVLSYIIAILNGLQELFLFASHAYIGKVFHLYRNAIKKFRSICLNSLKK